MYSIRLSGHACKRGLAPLFSFSPSVCIRASARPLLLHNLHLGPRLPMPVVIRAVVVHDLFWNKGLVQRILEFFPKAPRR